MAESCKTCRFLRKWHGDGGHCRRLPPVAVIIEGDVVWTHPPMEDDDWCGEYWYGPVAARERTVAVG